MEKFFYEVKPYFFAALAVGALSQTNMTIHGSRGWCLMLLLASVYLMRQRLRHRAAQELV